LPLLPAEEQPGLKRIQGALQLSAHVLALVRKAVSVRLLAKLTEIDTNRLIRILRDWDQFLRSQQVEREKRYTIYHASFSDFLKEEAEESGVDLEDIKRRIADNFSQGAPL
jgi:flavin-dependent dehydrogenase